MGRRAHPRSNLVRTIVVMWALTVPLAAQPAVAAPAGSLKVMTRNLYLGADLGPVFGVTSFDELVQRVTEIWGVVQATDFPERAEALADEIADTNPQVVGLQEVALWRSQIPGDGPATRATTVEYDFLQLLLQALEARGLHYRAAASVTNFDVEAPRLDPTSPNFLQDIRLTDRDVILTRTDLPAKKFSVSNPQGERFDAHLVIDSPLLGQIDVDRGWTAVDVTVPEGTVRVVSTHLERLSPPVQIAQGAELLAGPAETELPVILLGDLNSAAGSGGVAYESDTPTYDNMLSAGFVDAWSQRHGSDAGFTCCQAEDLRNLPGSLSERIDLVLLRGELGTSNVQLVGDDPADRTPSGLWPSDHAGVRAVLRVA